MARRRKKSRLGSTGPIHTSKASSLYKEVGEWAEEAEDGASRGKCSAAIQAYGMAAERLGRARAHVTSGGGDGGKLENSARLKLREAEGSILKKCVGDSLKGLGDVTYRVASKE